MINLQEHPHRFFFFFSLVPSYIIFSLKCKTLMLVFNHQLLFYDLLSGCVSGFIYMADFTVCKVMETVTASIFIFVSIQI